MPGIAWSGLAFGCVTALGKFLRSIFDISSWLSLGFRKSERQWPRKATAKGGRCKLARQHILITLTRRRLPSGWTAEAQLWVGHRLSVCVRASRRDNLFYNRSVVLDLESLQEVRSAWRPRLLARFLIATSSVGFYNGMREFGFYRSPFLEASPD